METPENSEFSGILSKKKPEHGRFEDPYKSKVRCWIGKTTLYIRSLGADRTPAPGSIPEPMDLILWKIGEREGGKFSLLHPGGGSIKLRADTQQEADLWINHITSGIKRAKEEETQNRLNSERSLRQQAEESAAKLRADEEKSSRDKAERAKMELEIAAKEKAEKESAALDKIKKAEKEQRAAKELQERAAKELQEASIGHPKDEMQSAASGSTFPKTKVNSDGGVKTVVILLKEVHHLPQRSGGGACDVFAVASIGDTLVFQTDVVVNEYNARWNQDFTAQVGQSQEVLIEIFDKDAPARDSKTYIGCVRIPSASLSKEISLPVLGKDGAAVRGKDQQITMLSVTVTASDLPSTAEKAKTKEKILSSDQGSKANAPSSEKESKEKAPSAEKENRNRSAAQNQSATEDVPKSLSSGQTTMPAGSGQESPSLESQKANDMPSCSPTVVRVMIQEVEHLPRMDLLGTCDAFAIASIGSQRFETTVNWNSYSACWKQEFEFQLREPDGENLRVELFDKDKTGVNNFIGSVQIPLLMKEYSREGGGVKRLPVLDKKGTGVRGHSSYITMLTVVIKSTSISSSSMTTPTQSRHSNETESKNLAPSEDKDFDLFGPAATPGTKIQTAPPSFKDAINFELKLQMDFAIVSNMEIFRTQVVTDVAQAADVEKTAVQVLAVRAGSVIVDMAISSDARDSKGRGALDVARSLEQQAINASSQLLQGKYTCKTMSLRIKRPEEDASLPQAIEEPKVPNHAQKVAAKLYNENSDLTGRLKNIAEKLLGALDSAASGEAAAQSPETLLEQLLAKLAGEKNARDQAEAAFDLATAEAMKHESEKDEALIERDFLKSELMQQTEAHEKERIGFEDLRKQLSEAVDKLTRVELFNSQLEQEIGNLKSSAESIKYAAAGDAQEVQSQKSQIAQLEKKLALEIELRCQSESAVEEMKRELETSNANALLKCNEQEAVLETVRSSNQDLHLQIASQNKTIESLEREATERIEVITEFAVVKSQLAEANDLVQRLRLDLEHNESKAISEASKFTLQITNLQDSLSKAQPEQTMLMSDCERLRTALSAEQRAKLELEERVHKLQSRIVSLQGDLDAARLERRELEALVVTLREEVLDHDGPRKEREREMAREALAPRSTNSTAPRTPSHSTRSHTASSPAAHLFMAGTLSGTPGKVAKILLGSSERHRLATSDYLASLLENTVEINRVGKGLLPEDMAEIASYVFEHQKIERMFLSGNNLGIGGAKQLADLLSRDTLKLQRLDLRHNNLGNQGCLLLMESLKVNESLTRLDLSANGLNSAAASSLASAIRTSTCLVRLDLRHNELGDSGAAEIAESLRQGTRLLHLDLSANAIGLKGAEVLARALQVNSTLEVLDIRGNALGTTGSRLLEQARDASPLASRQILLPVSTR